MKNKLDMLSYCSNWYKTFSGQSTLESLDGLCQDILSEIFGYYAVELGFLSGRCDLLQSSRIAASFSLVNQSFTGFVNNTQTSVISTIEQLPLATDNVDLVIASHVLELSKDPHQVLREIDRVLVPEGDCVLVGFNPYNFSRIGSHIRHSMNRKKHDYKMRSIPRVRDWFSLLGFEVVDVHYVGMRPALKNKRLYEAMGFLDNLGSYAGAVFGNIYVLHAKKRVVAMSKHKKVWMAPAVLSGGKVALNNTAKKIRRENYSNL